MQRFSVLVVGAGAAGLGLAVRLAEGGLPGVGLVQSPVPAPSRTWCSWQRGPVPWHAAVSASWRELDVVGPEGERHRLDLAPYRYEMVRSRDFERWAQVRLDGVTQVTATVEDVVDAADAATVQSDVGELRADVVFDTRPVQPVRPPSVALLQHFRGWFVRLPRGLRGTLMDFRVPQPPRGVAFGYVLPTSPTEALVEYTEFSPAPLSGDAYDDALRHYAHDVLQLPEFDVVEVEQGVIPMTDGAYPTRVGERVFRLGAAGGATRASTGYTFAAAQRQSAAVAAALLAHREPVPPRAYPHRHQLMDAVLLRALASGRLDGARFFTDLFARHPPARVLRFLDGASSPLDELRVMASAPPSPMMRSLR